MLRNGPKGIILSLLVINITKAIGKAMNVAKKMLHIDKGYPKTKPIRNISLISPPPSDSCLNIISPIFFIANIVINDPVALNTLIAVSLIPILNKYKQNCSLSCLHL